MYFIRLKHLFFKITNACLPLPQDQIVFFKVSSDDRLKLTNNIDR